MIKAEQDAHLLSDEARRTAEYLRIDFEKGGIHLCQEKLDRVNLLNIDIVQLCRESCGYLSSITYPQKTAPSC